jgi:hypothetical protein
LRLDALHAVALALAIMSQLDLKRTFGLISAPGHNVAQALLADSGRRRFKKA